MHFYYEENKFPWRLMLYREIFDHEIFIDYDSSDRALEIIKEYCRTCHKKAGCLICFIGAAAKGKTLFSASQINPDHLLDESTLKIGFYAPGCNTLVEPLTAIASWKISTFFVLSSWNFRIELKSKMNKIVKLADSIFCKYVPQPRWIFH